MAGSTKGSLRSALKSKKVAAAAFTDDVRRRAGEIGQSSLALDNFICSPAYRCFYDWKRKRIPSVGIAEQIVEYFTGDRPVAPSTFPPCLPSSCRSSSPIFIGRACGLVASAIIGKRTERLTVEYSGEVAGLNVAPLTDCGLERAWTPILEDPVNYVNAPVVAKERGIEVKEVKSNDAGDFTSVIRVRWKRGKSLIKWRERCITAKIRVSSKLTNSRSKWSRTTICYWSSMRIVRGVIGTVGHILATTNINIARMQCSREERGGKAPDFGLDAPLPAPVLDQITNSKHILSVKVADLSKGL